MLAYKMLSEGFKNNYFKNEASFIDYAITHFLGKNISFKENQTQDINSYCPGFCSFII